jgi:regulator of protease activity HflC (stomatin/prohibitin superfamily)
MNFDDLPKEKVGAVMKFAPLVFVLLFVFPKLLIVLLPIGFILFIVWLRASRSGPIIYNSSSPMQPLLDRTLGLFFSAAWKFAALVFVVILAWNSFIVVPAGVTGVYHLFGKVSDTELRSGFHVINPLAQVELMTIRTEQYTMTVSHEEGGQGISGDSIEALTKEGLKVTLDMTILYHLVEDKSSDVYKTLGSDYQEKIIRPEARSVIREIVSSYEAKDIYSDKRDEVVEKIEAKLRLAMDPRGLNLESVLVRNIVLPQMLTTAIEAKLTAEQESFRYDFLLQKETKEAERKRIEAAGQRDSQKIIDSSLSKEYLQYLYIKELKDRQGTIYVPYDMPMFKGI